MGENKTTNPYEDKNFMKAFLTKGDKELEEIFDTTVEMSKFKGLAVTEFRQYIWETRNLDFSKIIEEYKDKPLKECKEILEEVFLEPLDIDFVIERIGSKGWNFEKFIKAHMLSPGHRLHKLLNTTADKFFARYA